MEKRIAKLERSCRCWKILTVLIALVPLLMGALGGPQSLTVRDLVVVDENGKRRARLGMAAETIGLELYGSNGDLNYFLTTSNTQTRMSMFTNKQRISMGTELVNANLILQDEVNMLSMTIDEGIQLAMKQNNTPHFLTSMDRSGNTSLSQHDDRGVRYALRTLAAGDITQIFFDNKTQVRAATSINQNNEFNHFIEKSTLQHVRDWLSTIKDLYALTK